VARSAFLSLAVPAFHAPDENEHFDYVQRLAETGRLPEPRVRCEPGFSPEVRELMAAWVDPIRFRAEEPLPPRDDYAWNVASAPADRSTTGCGPAAPYPPGYYAASASFYTLGARAPLPPRIWLARLASCLLGLVAAAAAYAFGRLALGSVGGGLVTGLAYVAQPQAGMLFSSVNSDALLLTATSLALAAVAWLEVRGARAPSLALLAVGGVLGALSKSTFDLYLPLLGLLAAAAMGWSRLRSWILAALALAPGAAVAAWWLVASAPARADYFAGAPTAITVGQYLQAVILNPERLKMIWVDEYWMAWGWLDALLPGPWYLVIEAMLSLAVIGVLAGWRRMERRERRVVVAAAATTGLAVAGLYVLELDVVRRTSTILIQGRYLLPLLPLQLAAIAIGLRRLGERLGAALDGAWVLPAVLALMSTASVLRLLGRYYA
jgi:hypothetical protein